MGLRSSGSHTATPLSRLEVASAAFNARERRRTHRTDSPSRQVSTPLHPDVCRTRAWKERLQVQVCDRFGLTVTVCHYPTGCSKWNPIERSLFSQISCNWAGVPLRTWDTVLGFIRGTKTSRGLAVSAIFQPDEYPTGQKITDAEMAALNLEHHTVCPTWNYTIRPRTPVSR